MENQKNGNRSSDGRLKSPFSIETLLISLMDDLANSLSLPIGDNDKATLSRRLASEGSRFAYVTLASLQRSLLGLLEFGVLPADANFSCVPGSTTPKFLRNVWKNLVDEQGRILPAIEESYDAVQSVRAILQVSTALTKYEEAFPKELIPQYLEEFVATDAALAGLTFPRDLISSAANVITQVFERQSLKDILPKHGPGAVATGERDEQKWAFTRLIKSVNRFYPFYDYFMGGRRLMEHSEKSELLLGLTRLETGTAKLIFVPKTATSLRSISMEMPEVQYLQQGQMAEMVRILQHHPLTRGHVNFDDQTVNQQLALVESKSRKFATIDLSSASDRLSKALVEELFVNVDDNILRYLLATRSSHTLLPNGEMLELNKFAPMGSATCFPTQSIVFFALCVASIQLERNVPLHVAARSVYVYGDDIVIPSEDVNIVGRALESVGLKVNYAKSFSRGWFRESCGMFAFAGYEVTPLRFRKTFPQTRGDGRGIASWLAYAHDCEQRGYVTTADYIYTCIETLTGKLPYGLLGCGYFCRLAHSEYELVTRLSTWPHLRWHDGLQRIEIKVLGLHTPLRNVEFQSGLQRLLRDLVTDYSESDPSKTAVGRSAKPKATWHPIV